MGANLGQHAIRIAVKDRQTLGRMAGIMLNVCTGEKPDAGFADVPLAAQHIV